MKKIMVLSFLLQACGDPCVQKCREWGQFVNVCQDAIDNVNLSSGCAANASIEELDLLLVQNTISWDEDYTGECENGRQARRSCNKMRRVKKRSMRGASSEDICGGDWGDWESYILGKDCDGFVVFVTSNR